MLLGHIKSTLHEYKNFSLKFYLYFISTSSSQTKLYNQQNNCTYSLNYICSVQFNKEFSWSLIKNEILKNKFNNFTFKLNLQSAVYRQK